MRRAVFLDRDGVLNQSIVRNRKPYPPATLAEFKLFPEASPALVRLKGAGFLLLVVTNQPDVARGRRAATSWKLCMPAWRRHSRSTTSLCAGMTTRTAAIAASRDRVCYILRQTGMKWTSEGVFLLGIAGAT